VQEVPTPHQPAQFFAAVERMVCALVLAALLIRALEERGRIAGGSVLAALTAAWIPCPERLITPVPWCGTDSRGGADDRSGQHRCSAMAHGTVKTAMQSAR